MRRTLVTVILSVMLVIPVNASELSAPEVQPSGRQLMPQNTDSFGEGLLELVQNSIKLLRPDLQEASQACVVVVISALVFSVLPIISQRVDSMAAIAGTVSMSAVMFQQTNSLLVLATDTVRDILQYGKLLCQVMTAALAAQGAVTASSALYIGSTAFITVLNSMISRFMMPMIFFYLVFSVSFGAFGDEFLKKDSRYDKEYYDLDSENDTFDFYDLYEYNRCGQWND